MSTVKTTNLQHPSASDVGITLGADGSVVLPQGFTGGIGSNVVQAVKTDVFSSSSATLIDIPDLEVTITPSSATSKVLVVAHVIGSHNRATSVGPIFILDRAGVQPFLGDADGSRTRTTVGFNFRDVGGGSQIGVTSFMLLDSPASASAVTYKVRGRTTEATTWYINRSEFDTNSAVYWRPVSSLTVIEVAA